MTISEDDVIQAVNDNTAFSCGDAGSNILYDSSTRTQGNFQSFYARAQAEMAEDLKRIGKIATDAQKITGYSLLIGAYQDRKDPDTFSQGISVPGYSVTKTVADSGYYIAYKAFLDSLPLVDLTPESVLSDDPEHVSVSEYYPDDFRMSTLNRNGSPEDSGYVDPW
jgi:hypothetical protein